MAGKGKDRKKNEPVLHNRNARREYDLLEFFEAGIVLSGPEVKALRAGRGELRDAFARIHGNEAFLLNMHVSPYEHGNRANLEPARSRKLLLKRSEISRLAGLLSRKGMSLVPLKLYWKRGFAKIDLAVGKGKTLHDRREDLKERAVEQDRRRGE